MTILQHSDGQYCTLIQSATLLYQYRHVHQILNNTHHMTTNPCLNIYKHFPLSRSDATRKLACSLQGSRSIEVHFHYRSLLKVACRNGFCSFRKIWRWLKAAMQSICPSMHPESKQSWKKSHPINLHYNMTVQQAPMGTASQLDEKDLMSYCAISSLFYI